jgi:CHAT domain-containing protein
MPSRIPKSRVRGLLVLVFLCSFTFCLWLSNVPLMTKPLQLGGVVSAQSPNGSQLVQQGLEFYQAGDITAAIKRWKQALDIYQQNHNSASETIVRENLARAYQQIAEPGQAIEQWDKVIAYYRQVANSQQLGRSLTEQAQAYNKLGQPIKAIALLCDSDKDDSCNNGSAVQIARVTKDLIGEAAALGSLGDARRLTGDYESATISLGKSLEIVKKLNNPSLRISVFNSLANAHISLAQEKYRRADSATQRGDTEDAQKLTKAAQQEDANALKYLQESLEIAHAHKNILGEVRSHLRIVPLYYRNNDTTLAATSIQQTTNLLERLPDSRERVYATIDLVRLLQPVTDKTTFSRIGCIKNDAFPQATTLLKQAVAVAQRIKDFRAESFALGELGHLYECRQAYTQAMEITSKARLAAEQGLKAQDSLYLWEWQTGRILKAQGKTDAAISNYEQAIKTLDTIRRDILTANRDIQFDFRDTIEPIYRELVALRLSFEKVAQVHSKSLVTGESKENFRFILKTIDSLKLAELQNYFGNDCIIVPLSQADINEIGDSTTAFINTIILSDKTVVILTLPGGQNKSSAIAIKRQDFINKINQFRRGLESFRDLEYDTTPAKEVYDWLIRPFADDLKNSTITTLVFIQDGILRSVPMAGLYDGEQFLIQKYAIATIPSLNLTDIKPLNRQNLRILALGLSKDAIVDGKKLEPLSDVPTELAGVTAKIPGKKLLDDQFTSDRLKTELDKQTYPIIHIATHGEFGAEPEDTFIVTGKNAATGKNEKLSFNELEKQIRSVTSSNKPLELLTLTACKTAAGDERSTLGLAGVAVQAGAKSALASLWAIKDDSTAQIAIDFYTKLADDPNMSKAKALQLAQKELIEGKTAKGELFTHPAYWSPLILIGNWL